jgi:hypothetical protein
MTRAAAENPANLTTTGQLPESVPPGNVVCSTENVCIQIEKNISFHLDATPHPSPSTIGGGSEDEECENCHDGMEDEDEVDIEDEDSDDDDYDYEYYAGTVDHEIAGDEKDDKEYEEDNDAFHYQDYSDDYIRQHSETIAWYGFEVDMDSLFNDDSSRTDPFSEGETEICQLFLAPSTIPGAGLGTFTGRPLKQGEELLGTGDVAYPIYDFEYHHPRQEGTPNPTADYVWHGPELGMFVETSDHYNFISGFAPGL